MTGKGSQKVTHMVMADVHNEASTGAGSKSASSTGSSVEKMGGAIPEVVYFECFRYGTISEQIHLD